jgi:integrase
MSILKTATGAYQIRWYDADGVSRKETFRGIDRREAERIEREKLSQRDRGDRPTDERNAPTFRTFSETVWMAEGRPRWKHGTIVHYTDTLKHVTATFGELRVSEIREAKVAPWIAQLRGRGLSVRRVNALLRVLKMVLKLARRRGLVREDALVDVRLSKPPKRIVDPMDPEEITAFLAECPPWWHPYFAVAFGTGMRPNEEIALKWGDVDWHRGSVRIQAGRYRGVEGLPKSENSVRDVDLLPMAMDALKRQKARQAAQRLQLGQGAPEAGKDYIFTTPGGALVDIDDVRKRVWYPTLTKAKLRRREMYSSRHGFASNALAAGENPAWVAAMLGDTLEMVFSVYARYIPNLTRRDGSALAARFAGQGQTAIIQGCQTGEIER